LIPESVLEAAEIDGARGLRLITRIILPMLKETLLVILMFRTIHAFKVFDLFYVLTGGGPGNSTEILNTYIQKVFMMERRIGYGSALSVICIALIGVLAFLFRKAVSSQDGGRS
jgi:multiple sugar transport system permease protein